MISGGNKRILQEPLNLKTEQKNEETVFNHDAKSLNTPDKTIGKLMDRKLKSERKH